MTPPPASTAAVSVVIPAFNAEPFIERTLRSVLAQTHSEMEVIVVDDGSTDGTRDLVSAIGPPVTLVAGGRRGVSAARNDGVRRSRGRYVAFLDHDDHWEPDKLRRQVELMESDPSIGLVFTQARVVRDGQVTEIFPVLPDPGDFLAKAHENLVHWNYIPMSAVAARRDLLPGLDGSGPFDERFRLSEDWDLWLRMAAALGEGGIGFIPEPLVTYEIVPGRATERMADLRLEDLVIFEEQMRAHPGLRASDPRRCRSTLYRLHEEAGYWLLQEGRRDEALPILRAAWRLRPASIKPLARLATSWLGIGGQGKSPTCA